MTVLYDELGVGYAGVRGTDPRIAARIQHALGGSVTVLNVGAGTGSYEPSDLDVTAVEPSGVMIAQRPAGSARVLQASAEALPFPDRSFDAAMAVVSDHHWRDRKTGLRELRRVARQRVLLFNVEPSMTDQFWLTRDYLPQFTRLIPARYRQPGYWSAELSELLGELAIVPVPIPWDCRDGFHGAHWRRPEAYLDPEVRAGISLFARLDRDELARALARLRTDLERGHWHRRNASIVTAEELDLGYRLVVATIPPA